MQGQRNFTVMIYKSGPEPNYCLICSTCLIEIAHVVNLNVKSTSTSEIINQRKRKQIVN